MIWARILGLFLLLSMLVVGGDLFMKRFPNSAPAQVLRDKTLSLRLNWMRNLQQEILKTHDRFEGEGKEEGK